MEFVADAAERLDHFLVRMFPDRSRSKLVQWIDSGLVDVDGQNARAGLKLAVGMKIEVAPPGDTPEHLLVPAEIPLELAYEDEYMLVVNKPRGLASHPAATIKEPTLVEALLARSHELSIIGGSFRPGIVHRLDKDTTGLLAVAKTDEVHVKLAKQIENKTAERWYVTWVQGSPEHERFTINAPIGRDTRNRQKMAVDPKGRTAITHLFTIVRRKERSLIAAKLETGRTHQIRVHLRSVGLPVVGDPIYGVGKTGGPLQLHATALSLDHPEDGRRIHTFAAPPEDFEEFGLVTGDAIQSLGGEG